MIRLISKLSPSFYMAGCTAVYRVTLDTYGFRMLPSDFLDAYMMGGEL
jgi:hypothetical protein